MAILELRNAPVVKTGMLIRRPVEEAFEAFVNPAITSKFWFTKGSGRLETGKQVEWEWATYGFSIPVMAKAVEPYQRILVEWPGSAGTTEVVWMFEPRGTEAVFVEIANSGFVGDGDQVVQDALNSTEGFTLVLAGLKAFLEHGIVLNLVADRFPTGLAKG